MPALLFLLHRRRARLDLFARADLVSIPPAVLLQWAQLACPKTHRRRDRLYACRQRLCAHRRLATGADVGRSALARRAASHPRSLCQAVLSGVLSRFAHFFVVLTARSHEVRAALWTIGSIIIYV